MPFSDLRDFMGCCAKAGELARIAEPVNPIDELATVAHTSILRGRDANRALLFERVEGYPETPVLVNLLTNRSRYYLAFETDQAHFYEEYIRRTQRPLAPRIVRDGPCKETVVSGADFSLLSLPAPKWHARDGGRFITAGCWITRDRDTGRHNVGVYRGHIHDEERLGVLAAPYRGLQMHAKKAWAAGERLPVAIVIGCDPAVYLAACAEWSPEVDELEMAGAFRQEPVDVVRCERSDLLVPATAEIVIEAEMDPDWREREGPFGEFTGFYGGGGVQPYVRVLSVSRRTHPIFHAAIEGRPPSSEASISQALPLEAELKKMVTVPGLRDINICRGSCWMVVIAQIDKQYEGHGKAMGMAILAVPGARGVKTVIVVDRDVNPFDWTEVEWALAVRVKPERDVEILKDMLGVWLDPSLDAVERETRASRTSKMIIDATQPLNADYPPQCDFLPEVAAQVAARWPRFDLPY